MTISEIQDIKKRHEGAIREAVQPALRAAVEELRESGIRIEEIAIDVTDVSTHGKQDFMCGQVRIRIEV